MRPSTLLLTFLMGGALGACSSHQEPAYMWPGPLTNQAAVARAHADSLRYAYTDADAEFMTGMIMHHAQAVLISGWAATHGASSSVQLLASRIINSQRDEILKMQHWLADRGRPVPRVSAKGEMLGHSMLMDGSWVTMNESSMKMSSHAGMTRMPGMLDSTQLAALDAARSVTFDTLFLKDMIQHHSGAIEMVKQLFATDGAGQDQLTFKFANDVQADQRTEIARMQRMLAGIIFADYGR